MPSPQHVLGLQAASHILAVDNALVARAYTPITLDRYDKGYFDLVVKRYKGGEFSERFHRCTEAGCAAATAAAAAAAAPAAFLSVAVTTEIESHGVNSD